MKRIVILAYTIFLILLSIESKGQNKVYFPQVFFDKNDAITKLEVGKSTIKGVAFTRENNYNQQATKHLANKTLVILLPMTAYLEEWLKLNKSRGTDPNVKIVMSEDAFKYRLETLTDAYGNFTFTQIKPGTYYIQCDIDFVGTDSGVETVGRTNYYNGYGIYMGSNPIYQRYFYNYNAKNRESKVVVIEEDGQLEKIKLKPPLFENYANIGNRFISTTKCYQLNNLQFGDCTEFYENGTIKTNSEWNKGLLDGNAVYYYENGKKQAEGEFKNDSKVNIWKYYDEAGQLTTEEMYVYKNKKSVREGVCKYYYPSGKLKIVDNYINDLAEGDSKEYYESGKVKIAYTYKNSKIEGDVKYYDEDGVIYLKTKYKNGIEIK